MRNKFTQNGIHLTQSDLEKMFSLFDAQHQSLTHELKLKIKNKDSRTQKRIQRTTKQIDKRFSTVLIDNKNFLTKLKFLVKELAKKTYKSLGTELENLQILTRIDDANGVEAIIDYIDSFSKSDYERMLNEGAALSEELLAKVPKKFYKEIFDESYRVSPSTNDVFRFWCQVLLLRKLKGLTRDFREFYLEKEDLAKINKMIDRKIKKLLIVDCKVFKKMAKRFSY